MNIVANLDSFVSVGYYGQVWMQKKWFLFGLNLMLTLLAYDQHLVRVKLHSSIKQKIHLFRKNFLRRKRQITVNVFRQTYIYHTRWLTALQNNERKNLDWHYRQFKSKHTNKYCTAVLGARGTLSLITHRAASCHLAWCSECTMAPWTWESPSVHWDWA